MPKFLVLIYGNERKWADSPQQWHDENGARHQAFIAEAGAAIAGANELEPTSKAVSVRAGTAGRPSVTDGPFMETKEVVGGYYVLNATDMEEAVALASRIPEATATHGGVEVRRIVGS